MRLVALKARRAAVLNGLPSGGKPLKWGRSGIQCVGGEPGREAHDNESNGFAPPPIVPR
jgi:hypothetical protein